MDKKIIAVALVVILVVAGVAVFFAMKGKSDKSLSVIGRVNSEGSGILLDPDQDPDSYITIQSEAPGLGVFYVYNATQGVYYVFNSSGWGGKIFATPGTATIQHVQLAELASCMGLKFAMYTEGSTTKADTLYYVPNIASFADFTTKKTNIDFAGFIIWEAQFAVGIVSGYKELVLTNDIFEGHNCCIIGASNKYLSKNADTIVAFLYAYSKAVDKINDALQDKESQDYLKLVQVAMEKVSMPESMTEAQKREAITSALDRVTYVYADGSTGSLGLLQMDIANLAEKLVASGVITNSAKDLGFDSYDAMAKKFVDDSYMKRALSNGVVKPTSTVKINVAAIKGDIHQIALWYGIETGMFAEMNIEVSVSQQVNGPGVYTQLANGESDIGFLGAPPMTIRTMNAEQIKA